jgi:hypothetical protein
MPRLTPGIWVFAVLATSSVFAQNPPSSTQQATAYAAQAIAAMTGRTPMSDVTLTGTVTWNGSDTGTATLRALGTGESRMDLTLASGTRTEIRDAQTGVPLGQWIAPNNTSGNFVFQNCWTDAVWFFPVLGSLAAGPNVVLSIYWPRDSKWGECATSSVLCVPAQSACNDSHSAATQHDGFLPRCKHVASRSGDV